MFGVSITKYKFCINFSELSVKYDLVKKIYTPLGLLTSINLSLIPLLTLTYLSPLPQNNCPHAHTSLS